MSINLKNKSEIIKKFGKDAKDSGFGRGQIRLVQHEYAVLVPRQPSKVQVAGGQRRAGVAELDHRVHGPQLVGQQPPGFGHVAGVPVDAIVGHGFFSFL